MDNATHIHQYTIPLIESYCHGTSASSFRSCAERFSSGPGSSEAATASGRNMAPDADPVTQCHWTTESTKEKDVL
jgi:hypothetical protein